EEVTAIWEEPRPEVGGFLRLRLNRGHLRGDASIRGDAAQSLGLARPEENRAVSVPRTAELVAWHVAERLYDAAGHIHFLELRANEEADVTAVGRPERLLDGLARGLGWLDEWGGLDCIEPADPELVGL